MERVFFKINEELARTAHNLMSFSEYETGRRTKEYEADVNAVYDLADRVAELRPEEAGRAYALAEKYSRKMAEYINKDSAIGTRCPSVAISGAGNFPVKKKQKQVAAWDRNNEFYEEVQAIKRKIEKIPYSANVIRSDDKDAVRKLEERLAELKKLQEEMKEANKAIRMKDQEKGDQKLREMGYSEEQIKKLREPDFCGRVGYPNYALTNNNSNIHRIEGRIKELQRTADQGSSEEQTDLFKVVYNTTDMRVQLFFDGKPEPEVRETLKGQGFRWAPSVGAWQRQLTDNAKYAVKQIIRQLEGEKA